MTTLLIVGATGLVGRAALRQALADPRVERVVAPTRRALPAQPRLENPLVDFDALPGDAPWWRVDGVVCALGTTMRAAGSREAFRTVDFEYPLAVARFSRQHGARAFALVSSVGAGPRARTYYLRVKAETERALAACGLPSLTIVRPSLLGGERAEPRPMERLALAATRALAPLVPRRYRVVEADRVAAALLEGAIGALPGVHVVESEAL